MKIKRIAALLLAEIMSVGLCSCASSNTSSAPESSSAAESNADSSAADSTDSTASEGGDWQYIADKGNFVAGITLFEPMNYYDENGELTGFETEFTKAVCEKLGVEAKFQEIKGKGLKLDMSRGKPSAAQLDLSMGMMDVLSSDDDLTCEDGTDCRNYGVLTGMALPLLFFPNALTGSMSLLLLPMVSEADARGNTDAVKNTTLKTIYSCLLLGAACTLFFFLSGPFLGRFLFHSELAGRYIRSLSLLCPFLYLCTTLSGILHGLGKAVSVFFVNVFSLSLRLLFVFFLIPAFGIDCYILSMVLSQLLSAFFYLFLLYRKWN